MRRWVAGAALLGLVGGGLGGLVKGVIEGAVRLQTIAIEGLLWGVSLGVAAAVAYVPSNWIGRGLAGGLTFGFLQGGLTVLFSLSEAPWAAVMGGEIAGGILVGLLLAYLWRSREFDADG